MISVDTPTLPTSFFQTSFPSLSLSLFLSLSRCLVLSLPLLWRPLPCIVFLSFLVSSFALSSLPLPIQFILFFLPSLPDRLQLWGDSFYLCYAIHIRRSMADKQRDRKEKNQHNNSEKKKRNGFCSSCNDVFYNTVSSLEVPERGVGEC